MPLPEKSSPSQGANHCHAPLYQGLACDDALALFGVLSESDGSHDYSAPVSGSPGRRFGVLSEGSHDYNAPVSGSPGSRLGVLSEGSHDYSAPVSAGPSFLSPPYFSALLLWCLGHAP